MNNKEIDEKNVVESGPQIGKGCFIAFLVTVGVIVGLVLFHWFLDICCGSILF